MFLSIIIPVYNTPVKFLKECLDSLKFIPSFITSEIIIVNDGSKDEETLTYLSSLDKLKYQIISQQNKGLSSARNEGIKVAKGVYIFPLDSDDVLNKNFEGFINYLQNNSEVDVLYGDLLYFGDTNKVEKKQEFNKIALWFESNIIPACSFFKKRAWETVGGYDESLKTFEDYDFWIQLAVNNFKFKYLPCATYNYRLINNGASLYQSTRALHKTYFKIIRDKIPTKEITFLGIRDFMKGYYVKKAKSDDTVLKVFVNYIKTFVKTLEMLKRIMLSSLRKAKLIK
ncbi:glycosyltransferase [Tenacibaculum discolor]|uniref:glycosyltransferase n=1 Tax=Tenacibaculum discolor TaxID=361581 RepID=UPI000EAE4824|nr:glycosyltransferase [Tenacibaculum discolor]RLK02453.1 glycosyltransferase involved in cell wall biosynthesis [Tenacibaculum discolor]